MIPIAQIYHLLICFTTFDELCICTGTTDIGYFTILVSGIMTVVTNTDHKTNILVDLDMCNDDLMIYTNKNSF